MAKDREKKSTKDSDAVLDKKRYAELLEPLQLELNRMARWLQATGKRLVVVVEGRDPGDLTTIEDPSALQQIRDAVKA